MMTTQVQQTTVTLESIGPVDISEIFVPVDTFAHHATGRPSPGYYEVAVLWGNDQKHCHIVDSNYSDRGPADRLYESLTDSTQLAKYMHHVLTAVPTYEWE